MITTIRNHLLTQTALVADLGLYDFGDGDAPAIFTFDPAPEDSSAPLIVISQTGGSAGGGDRAGRKVTITGTVTVWGDRQRSDVTLLAIAEKCRLALDRAQLSLTGYTVFMAADAPQKMTDADGFPGYVVTWTAQLWE